MKFTFRAEWALTAGDTAWLRDYYFPMKWNEAVASIRKVRAIDGHAFDPLSSGVLIGGQEMTVWLKADNWVTGTGGAAGQFFPPVGDRVIPDLWVNWTREMDPSNNLFGRIVRHELIHCLLWLQYPPKDGDFVRYDAEWQNSEHGRQAPTLDPFLLALNRLVDEFYPLNNASSVGRLPC